MKSFFRLKSIRSKLLLISIVLLTVPLIILGVLSFNTSRTALDQQGAKQLETSVVMTIEMIDALNSEVEKGTISLEDAQEKVKEAILDRKDSSGNRGINDEIDLGEYGYVSILDQNGVQVAHPFDEGVNHWEEVDSNGSKFIQEMIEAGNRGGDLVYYDWPLPHDDSTNEPKVTYSESEPHWDWVVYASTYMYDFNKESDRILYINILVTVITLAIGIVIVWLFTNRMTKPINAVVDQMDEVAEGNLNLEPLVIESEDETAQLAKALNDMQTGLRKVISNVHSASTNMASQSEELTQAANEVSEGTEQVAATMEEISSGVETQADRSEEIANMMSSFVTKIEHTNDNGMLIEKSSDEVIELTKQGRELMDTSTDQMHKIDEIVHDAVQKVDGLDRHSQEISELVLMIQDIAEQTNLLALNAAIEAARAGEHGQGFAVVADEVRKLAEESSHSVVHITEIVKQIQNESSTVADSLRNGYSEVEEGTSHIVTTGEMFVEIYNSINGMVARVEEMSNNLNDIVANSQEMNSNIEDIAAVSEESAAGVEETTATTQQASSTMEEVASSSNELAILAEELSGLVDYFRL